MGVASHPPDEMAIHVDANADADADAHACPADGNAHDDIDANVDDIITGVDLTDVEVVLGGFVINKEYENYHDIDDRMTRPQELTIN